MMADKSPRPRQLLVALDASPESTAILDAAAELAARLRADIRGLFIEDTDLLNLAHDPLVRIFSPTTGRAQTFTAESIERTLRRRTEEARRALQHVATNRHLRSVFDVRRGRVAVAVIEEAGEEDLIVICRGATSADPLPANAQRRAGSTAREIIARATRPVLIINERAQISGRVFVAYDGSPAARLALGTAAEISDRRRNDTISVVLMAADDATEQQLRDEASGLLLELGHQPVFEHLPDASLESLCATVSRAPASILVVGSGQEILGGKDAPSLLERIACSVLVVR